MMDANSDEDMNADSFVKPATQNSVERDIVMLKTDQTQEQLEQPKKYVHSPQEQAKLTNAIKQTKEQIAIKRQTMNLKRQELKNLSVQVEQQLQKAITSIKSKQPALNISDYFSKEDQTDNAKIQSIKQELKRVRAEQDRLKKELMKFKQEQANRSIGVDIDKLNEIRSKINVKNDEIEQLTKNKDIFTKQLQLIESSLSTLNTKQSEEVLQKHVSIKAELTRQTKIQRATLYEIEKEDRHAMEKIKFLTQAMMLPTRRKMSLQDVHPEKTKERMGDIVMEIHEMMEERYKTEDQSKQSFERLKEDVEKLEKENWTKINKLREYDAYLLRHYNAIKSQKRNSKRDMSVDVENSSKSMLVREDLSNPITPSPTPITQIHEQPQFVHIGVKDNAQNIVVRDYYENCNIKEIILYQLNNTLIGIEALYEGQIWEEQKGNKILAFPKNKETQSQTFKISYITSFEMSLNEETQEIMFLRIFGKDDEPLVQWPSAKPHGHLIKKTLPEKYKSICLVGCLRHNSETAKNPNEWHLSGVGFDVVALVERVQGRKVRSIVSRRIKNIAQ